jgi:stage III sporulation protein AG
MRMARALSAMEGAGRVRVLLNERQTAAPAFAQQGAGEVVGVVILAEGADDAAVRLALSGAAQTLLGVEAVQVEVLKLEAG